MKNFEEKLERLEDLGDSMKNSNLSIEEALKVFEEGIQLAKSLEKEIDKIESKIQVLINQPDPAKPSQKPELDLFSAQE